MSNLLGARDLLAVSATARAVVIAECLALPECLTQEEQFVYALYRAKRSERFHRAAEAEQRQP